MADGDECHEGRCTHKKVCCEVVKHHGHHEHGGDCNGKSVAGHVTATLTWKDLNVTVTGSQNIERHR